jgi:hypothetical protein
VHDGERQLFPQDQALQVHQAGHVVGGDDFGAGRLVVVQAVEAHHDRDRLFVDGESAAKAAAFVGAGERDEFDSSERAEELPGLAKAGSDDFARTAQPEFAKSVAALMETDAVGKAPFDSLDLQYIDEKLGEFQDAGPQRGKLALEAMAVEIFGVVLPDHRRATSRGADDVFVGSKDLDEPLGERSRVGDTARIGHRLSAAGLLVGELDLTIEPFEQLECGEADLGIELIDVAGNEQANARHRRVGKSRRRKQRCKAMLSSLIDAAGGGQTATTGRGYVSVGARARATSCQAHRSSRAANAA